MNFIKSIFTIANIILFTFALAANPNCDPTIWSESFENGFGIFTKGGNDAFRVQNHATDGSFSALLRDNSGENSSIYTGDLDLSGAGAVAVSFDFTVISMEEDENFILESSNNGGATWTIRKTWASGTHFNLEYPLLGYPLNNQSDFSTSVRIQGPFSPNTRIRLRCDASGNGDKVFIDNVLISTDFCDDGDPCTGNDVLDTNCNCAGVYEDADNDGECANLDPNDYNALTPNPYPSCGDHVYDDIENGWDLWNDGGSDCTIAFAAGSDVIQLRDNSGTASSTFTDAFPLESYVLAIRIEFQYATHSFELGEDFFLEFSNDGINYVVVKQYIQGTHFANNEIISETVQLHDNTYLFGATANRFRIRSDASGNGDYLFIDNTHICEIDISYERLAAPEASALELNTLNVYPNPISSSESMTIEVEDFEDVSAVEIYNSKGVLVTQTEWNSKMRQMNIPMTDYDSGMYIIRVVHEDRVQISQFILTD